MGAVGYFLGVENLAHSPPKGWKTGDFLTYPDLSCNFGSLFLSVI